MRHALALLFLASLAGCDSSTSGTSGNPSTETSKPSGKPVKMTAAELFDGYKIGKTMDGQRVTITGIVRTAETDRATGKAVLEGGPMPFDMMEVFFSGKVTGFERRDTITVTATVKGQVNKVLTLTDAALVSVTPKKAK